jgi:hypothetical protein
MSGMRPRTMAETMGPLIVKLHIKVSRSTREEKRRDFVPIGQGCGWVSVAR